MMLENNTLRHPYSIYEQHCEILRKLKGDETANLIIEEVDPKANVYDFATAVLRMYKVTDLARAGVSGAMLLEIVRNHQEDIALSIIHAGNIGAFDLIYNPEQLMSELTTEE